MKLQIHNMSLHNRDFMSESYSPPMLAKDYHEYESTDKDISVVGSLSRRLEFWKYLNTPDHLLRAIEHGYTIPLKTLPRQKFLKNNKTSRDNASFVRLAIDDLVTKGAVVEVSNPPRVVNPLTVSTKNGKQRLVLDLRHINKHVYLRKCKIEGHDTLLQYLPNASFMYGFDLKSGYHHLGINPIQHSLLGFQYSDFTGRKRYFTFVVLPFGLNSAGFIFTSLLKVCIRYWRSQQIQVVIFFYDGLGTGSSWLEACHNSKVVKTTLILAGWIPNRDKCVWTPSQILPWLGFIYDLIRGIVTVTEDKLERLLTAIQCMIHRRRAPVKALASISGSLTSMHHAYGDIVYLKGKSIVRLVGQDDNWNRYVTVNKDVKAELIFWLNYLPENNGMRLPFPLAAAAISYSDASATGCAAVITPCPFQKRIIVHRDFTTQEQAMSSTYRELLTVYIGLQRAKHQLRNKAVRWNTDAKNVISIVRKGSMKVDLHNIALKIFKITKRYNILLTLTWLRRNRNKEADSFSRVVEYDDWGVHQNWYKHISSKLGKTNIDRFADPWNTKCSRFNSRFFWQEAEAIDCFTQDWHHDENWLCPPIYMIVRAIKYLQLCQANGIIVVPEWNSAYFWPFVSNILTNEKIHIRGILTLGDIFTHYRNRNSLFGSSEWRGNTLVISLSYKNTSHHF